MAIRRQRPNTPSIPGATGRVRRYDARPVESDPLEEDPPVETEPRIRFKRLFDRQVLVVDGIVRGDYRPYGVQETDPEGDWYRCRIYHPYSETVHLSWKADGEVVAQSSLLDALHKVETARAED